MSTGWIKLHRSLIDWEWYDDTNATRLLIHLLVSVNYEDKNWKGITVKAGSMIFSWETLSAKCKLSVSECRTAMNKLIVSKEVSKQSTNKFQVVTLLKWDKLQSNEPTVDRQMTDDSTNESQSNDNQIAIKSQQLKNINKLIIKELKNTLLSEIKISDGEGSLKFKDKELEVSKDELLHFKIATSFQNLFIANLKEKNTSDFNQQKATYKSYVDPIRLMFEIDKVSHEQIQKVYKFLNSKEGEFWKANILSTGKLREKFEQLSIKAQTQKIVKGNIVESFEANR